MVLLFIIYTGFSFTHWLYSDKNKKTIVEEGAVPIFINLLKSNDVKLQNEAVGALRNLSLDGSHHSACFYIPPPPF